MTTESDLHDGPRDRPFWAGLTLAAVVSIAAISYAAGPVRWAAGLAPVPFGWHRLVVVQAVASLFLSWCLARMLAQWRPVLAVRWKTMVWAIAGLALAGVTVIAGVPTERLIETFGGGYFVRLVTRILWCTGLQIPWCMAGLAAGGGTVQSRRYSIPTVQLLALAVITVVAVPVSYLAVFLEQETARAHELWQQGQVVQAARLVQRLCDVGSRKSLGRRPAADLAAGSSRDVTPPAALADLKAMIDLITRQVDQLAAAADSEHSRMQLARGYIALDRPTEAAATLAPLVERSPRAALVLAQIHRRQERLDAAQCGAERVLEVTRGANKSAAEQEIALHAYDLLVILAGQQGDYAAAERYLLEALGRLPAHRAAIHDRLGRHYEITGDFRRALDHLRAAAQLDPAHYAPPEGLLAKMLSTGAPVGLARPKSSRYR